MVEIYGNKHIFITKILYIITTNAFKIKTIAQLLQII